MTTQESLKKLSDQQLLINLKSEVQLEREVLTRILKYLQEVERRRIFLNRGYPSLFEFCMGELSYSERQTHTRIQAMRLLRSVPEVEEKIESGALSLSVAATAQATFRRSDKTKNPVSLADKKLIVSSLCNMSVRKAEQILLKFFPAASIPNEKTRPVSSELTRIEFNANSTLLEKLEKLKKLTAHKNYAGRWDQLFNLLADLGLKQWEPKTPTKDDAALLATSQVGGDSRLINDISIPNICLPKNRSRNIPAAVKRFVWNRDHGRCQFRDLLTGRQCSSKHALQFDHRHRFADGGVHAPENLRLLCASHNQWREEW